MSLISKRFRAFVVYQSCFLLAFQPVLAEVVVDTNAAAENQAQVTTTATGVDLVNITQPNGSGLSHNKFDSYSVDEHHLILNNSTEAVNTLLGGQISANPNFNGQSASIILNEVTGADPSTLAGYTEIGGDQAELIIANPNGITCRGCGFINTPRASLTTGTPNIRNEQLISLSVNQGAIQITGEGVDTRNIDQLDLIGRSVEIDTNLLAKELNIITGKNTVDYQTLSVTARNGGNNNGKLAIDSSALGGMYANAIRLIATDDGVGVKLDGTMATDVGDIVLEADGTIRLKTAVAANDLSVTSHSGEISVADLAYAKHTELDAHGEISNNGTLAAETQLGITTSQLTNTGNVIAGLDGNNQLVDNSDLSIEATAVTNSGQMAATGTQTITATQVENINGSIQAIAGNVQLKNLTSLDNTNGSVQAGKNIELDITEFEATKEHGLNAGDTLAITTEQFNNAGEFEVASNVSITADQAFTNTGTLKSQGALTIQAQSLTNGDNGEIASGHTADFTAQDDIKNTGVITSQSAMVASATNITNVGTIASGGSLTLTASNAILNSNADANDMPIALFANSNGSASTANGGANGTLLFSLGDMNLYSDSLTNRYADIYSFGNLTVAKDSDGTASSNVINSSSTMEAAGAVTINTQLFDNRLDPIVRTDTSELCAEGDTQYLCNAVIHGGTEAGIPEGTALSQAWLFDEAYNIVNGGLSDDEEYAQVQAAIIKLWLAASRPSRVIAGSDLTINAGGAANRGGVLAAGNNLTVNANDFVNETIAAVTLGPAFISYFNYQTDEKVKLNMPVYLMDTDYYSANGELLDEWPNGDSNYRGVIAGEAYDAVLLNNAPFSENLEEDDILNLPYENKVVDPFALTSQIYAEGAPIFLSFNDRDDSELTYSTSMVDPNGYITTGQFPRFLEVDENNELLPNYSESLNELTNGAVSKNEATGEYELSLGGKTYAVVVEEKQYPDIRYGYIDSYKTVRVLRAQFDPDNLPIEFKIQKTLLALKATAEESYSYNIYDSAYQEENANTSFFQGKMTAGGTVTINATNTVTNGLVENDTVMASEPPVVSIPTVDIQPLDSGSVNTPSTLSPGDTPTIDGPDANPPGDIDVVEVDTDIPDNSGLFNESDDARYLVATNAAVQQFVDIHGSDYLLDQLGYTPEADVKRLGDGFYESYLVREAIMAQTGRRFLNAGIHSDQQQLQYLMDNAIAAYGSLDLTMGVRLNPEQVAALTHDMLWMEERLVGGQKVLVPVLYLAQIKDSDIHPNGSIVGGRININTGDFASSGSLISDSVLSISANNVFNQGSMSAKTALLIDASGHLTNVFGSSLKTGKDLSLHSGGDMVNETDLIVSGDIDLRAKNLTNTSTIDAGENLTLIAKEDLTNSGATLRAGEDMTLAAGGNLTLDTVTEETRTGSKKDYQTRIEHTGSDLDAGGNISLSAGENLKIIGSTVDAAGDIALAADGDISILAAENEVYSYKKETQKKLFNKKTKTTESFDTELVASELAAGGNLTINSQVNADGSITKARNAGNVLIAGSTLSADQEVVVAGDDVNVLAMKEIHGSKTKKTDNGFLGTGLGGSRSSTSTYAEELKASRLLSEEDLSLLSGGNIVVLGSDLMAKGDLNLHAVDDILISADQIINQTESMSSRNKLFSDWGSLYQQKDTAHRQTTTETQASQLQAGGDINLDASRIKIVGSELQALNDLNARTDVGDIEILSAEAGQSVYDYSRTLDVGVDGALKAVTDLGDTWDSIKDEGKLKVTLANADYDSQSEQLDSITQQASTLIAGGNLNLDAAGDIQVAGSDLMAGKTADFTAGGNVIMTESTTTDQSKREEITGTAEVSAIVQNQAVEVAKAVDALKDAKNQLKDAKEDYRQYQKDLDKLRERRAQLQADYDAEVPGVSYADLAALDQLIDASEADDDWYKASIVMASANLASQTTLAIQQSARLATTAATFGFDAGVQLDIDGTLTNSTAQNTTSRGTNVLAENIRIRTGEGGDPSDSSTLIRGSNLQASDSIDITTGDLNVEASRDTQHSNTDTGQVHAQVTQTLLGGAPSISLDASASTQESRTTTYTNSTLNADNITLTTAGDANLKGANIHADEQLALDIDGDLNLASKQNQTSSDAKNAGVNAGSGGSIGANAGSNRQTQTDTIVTSLTGQQVSIDVNGTTSLAGSTIAAIDEDGNDNGQLSLRTEHIEFTDLNDSQYSNDRSTGASTSLGNVGTSSAQHSNDSSYQEGKTLATLGQGEITTTDDSDTTRLNRDIDATDTALYNHERSQGDIDVTVDTRLLSESGRQQVKNDFVDNYEFGEDIYRSAEQLSTSDQLDLLNFWTALNNNTGVTQLKNDLVRNPENAAILAGLASGDGEQYAQAMTELGHLAQNKFGINLTDIYFYDSAATTSASLVDSALADVHGATVIDETSAYNGDIFLDAEGDKLTQVETLGHELLETKTQQAGGANDDTQEALADAFGGQFVDRIDQATGSELQNTSTEDWQTSLQSSQATATGTQQANNVGDATVDYHLTKGEMLQAIEEMQACDNWECQSNTYGKFIEQSAENLTELIINCPAGGSTSAACQADINKLNESLDAYKSGELFFYVEDDYTTEAVQTLSLNNNSDKFALAESVGKRDYKEYFMAMGLDEAKAEFLAGAAAAGVLGVTGRPKSKKTNNSNGSQESGESGTSQTANEQALKGNGKGDNGSFETEGDFDSLNQPVKEGGSSSGTIISPEMESKILYGIRSTNQQGTLTNRLIGAHSGNISNDNSDFAVETISTNDDGTRNVKLVTQFENGNVSRIKNSTLFPETWTDSDIISAVYKAAEGAPLATRASDGASLYQSRINGVDVEVIKVGENVTAGYPCGRGCTDPNMFGDN